MRKEYAMGKQKEYIINAEVILHSYGPEESDFEVIDIDFPEEFLTDEEMWKSNPDKASYMDTLIEMASEELNEYSETMQTIHKYFWKSHDEEMAYRVKVNLSFHDTCDYWGEYDTEVYADYEILEENIDMELYLEEEKTKEIAKTSPEPKWEWVNELL